MLIKLNHHTNLHLLNSHTESSQEDIYIVKVKEKSIFDICSVELRMFHIYEHMRIQKSEA